MITERGSVIKFKSNDLSGKVKLFVMTESEINGLKLEVKEPITDRDLSFIFSANGKGVEVDFNIDNPVLWSVNYPNLYRYTLEIKTANGVENASGTFGVRSLSHDGHYITVNGEPIFVRGYIRGETCHEHANTCNLSEEDFYRKNVRQAKKFGFNMVRFHSKVPTDTFFKVADEEGLLVHVEMRDPDKNYINQEEMLKARTDFVDNDFIQKVVDRLYNCPSFAVYCIGNEIKLIKDDTRIKEIGRFVKQNDDTRLYIDTCAWGANNREGVDLDIQHMSYYFPYGKHADMYENTENLLVCGCADGSEAQSQGENSTIKKTFHYNVPLLAHEVAHYIALRDFKGLKEKFIKYGTEMPWWVEEELKMIVAKGLEGDYDEMYKASKLFQYECWKTAFERIRLSKVLGGFHFLQFADTHTYENSNGAVDCFDDENYITAEQFKIFNGDAVLLADINERIYRSKGTLTVPIVLSNYAEHPDKYADFVFTLTGESGKVHSSGTLSKVQTGKVGLYSICKLEIELPNIEKAEKCTLKCSLVNEKGVFTTNEWKIWLFPEIKGLSYAEFCDYNANGVTVTNDIEKALTSLKQGKNTCLVYRSKWTRHLLDKKMPAPKYAFKATWNRFKPVIWDRGTNCGGICDNELLNKFGFVTDRFYDFNYSKITEDCDKIILDDFPVKVRSIISGIDKCVRDRFDAYTEYFNLPELQYDRTLRNFSYLFEVMVGSAKLLVCGLNMTGLDENEPSTVQMADSILKYLSSNDFAPKTSISYEDFVKYLVESAKEPVKERMMTQFWELDDTPVESLQYWTESREYLL